VPTPFSPGDEAACRTADPECFFDESRTLEALAVCAGCPLAAECLEYALENEDHGVWGGTTPEVRTVMRGGALAGTPEDRHLVWALHERIQRGDHMAEIAAEAGVNERTLYRWSRLRQMAPAA
jgi:WhiB family redox-sensing transcriptional regulator